MPKVLISALLLLAWVSEANGKVVVFWQEGFPTVESQPVSQDVLVKALDGMQPIFAGLEELKKPETLKDAELLVLPYGSAVPVDAWTRILEYLEEGGNLLNLGGRPFFVPVTRENGRFVQGRPQDTYARHLGIWHTYEPPQKDGVKLAWEEGYSFFSARELRARRLFVLDGENRGLGFLLNDKGEKVAAPVVNADSTEPRGAGKAMWGSRAVMLDFEPEPGYWSSPAGLALIGETAEYARQGATMFWLEMQNATLVGGEIPQVVVHLRNARRQRRGEPQAGMVRVELVSGSDLLATVEVTCSGDTVAANVAFQKTLLPGLYAVRSTYEDGGRPREFYQTGFWVEDERLLNSGPALGVKGDFLTKAGAPFLPFGTNYFTTDRYRQVFIGPGNAYYWDHDFAEMEKHGVTFVRTGVWNNHIEFLDKATGEANERFLRNLEAFLLSAGRHNIHVNFTFYAFDPQTVKRHPGEESLLTGPGSNPYTDPVAIRAQQNYILSVVNRFKNVPSLSWDLINEPSFSNPKHLWRGNTPNNDPTEIAAWHQWLAEKYGSIDNLANAWAVTSEDLGSFDSVPLPDPDDLVPTRYGNSKQVRALDYNLFAQAMFSRWVSQMVSAIRSTGSRQLVDVGQDEGGVSDRVLNQFFADAGVDFTVNHTYWRDDALLWDSVAAKRPGMPNFVGETGYQPVWRPDGEWRWDEVTGFPLIERKWALGFAAANSGALQWDWSLGGDFGIKRSDGSNKTWEDMMREMGEFAKKAAPYATGFKPPALAIVLPQSLQLSVSNSLALEAQQKCVRALYYYARAAAYVVGEYQIELLGNPKLIILPSPWILNQKAWDAILARVREGATLLVSGRFDADEHFHPTDRQQKLGIDYQPGLLATRENLLEWPGGRAGLSYSGDKTTYLERAFTPTRQTLVEEQEGKGRILFVPLPLELSDNLKAIGDIYRYALGVAKVAPVYTTSLQDPGILLCPTQLEKATLYVLTSESSSTDVSFRDSESGKEFTGKLEPGRAALLLVGRNGEVLASYNWKAVR
jgi:hypothetical protein